MSPPFGAFGCGGCVHARYPARDWRAPRPGQAEPTCYRGGWCALVDPAPPAGFYAEAMFRHPEDPLRITAEREDRALDWIYGRKPGPCAEYRPDPWRIDFLTRRHPLRVTQGGGHD